MMVADLFLDYVVGRPELVSGHRGRAVLRHESIVRTMELTISTWIQMLF